MLGAEKPDRMCDRTTRSPDPGLPFHIPLFSTTTMGLKIFIFSFLPHSEILQNKTGRVQHRYSGHFAPKRSIFRGNPRFNLTLIIRKQTGQIQIEGQSTKRRAWSQQMHRP